MDRVRGIISEPHLMNEYRIIVIFDDLPSVMVNHETYELAEAQKWATKFSKLDGVVDVLIREVSDRVITSFFEGKQRR